MLGGRAQKLQRGPKIGEGAFGNVYEGLYDGDQRVVLKEYKAVRGRDTRSFYEDELNACRRYSHVPSSSPQPASTVDLAAGSKRCLSSRAAPLSVLARVGPSSRMLTSRCGCAGWQTARGWQSSWVWRARTCTSCGAIRFEVRALSSGECDSKLLRPSCTFSSSSSSSPAQGAVTLERVLQSGEGLDALAEVLGAEDAEAAFGQFAASLLMAVNAMHVDGVVHRGARASVERGLTSAKPLSPAARSVSGAQIPCDALQPQRFDTHALDEGFRIADCGSWVAQSSSRPA